MPALIIKKLNKKLKSFSIQNENGLTLMELCIGMGLMGALTLGIMASIDMMIRMQTTLSATTTFNGMINYISQSIVNDTSCNMMLQAKSAKNSPPVITDLSSATTSITIYNPVAANGSKPAVYLQAGKQAGPLYVQSVNLVYNPSSSKSVHNSANLNDASTLQYSLTDKVYKAVIQVTALKGYASSAYKYKGYGNSTLSNFSLSDIAAADNGIPVSIRLDTLGRLVSCAGLRTGNLTPFSLPSPCPTGYAATSDGVVITCKKTNCSLGEIPQGTNSDGSLNCVPASCPSPGQVNIYINSASQYKCKQVVCPIVSGLPTLPIAYDSDGYISQCGSQGTYAIDCTPLPWGVCNSTSGTSSRSYTCAAPTWSPLSSYPAQVFYCDEPCAAKTDVQPCLLGGKGFHTGYDCMSVGGNVEIYGSSPGYYCNINSTILCGGLSGWTAIASSFPNHSWCY